MAESTTSQNPTKATQTPKDRLNQIIEIVLRVSEAKGWGAEIDSMDDSTFEFACVSVWKNVNGTDISGEFDIQSNGGLKFVGRYTSFHSYGFHTLRDAVWEKLQALPWLQKPKNPSDQGTLEAKAVLIRLLRRTHRGVRQLKHRYNDRAPLVLDDEYDLQDFLHAALRLFFDDIRVEEYAPSYAGGSSRLDFLLKAEKIVIETKFARPSLRDKQIGQELIIDIARYKTHPDCRSLLCLVYDPNSELKNPAGLEADLTKVSDGLDVHVIVVSPS